MNSLAIVIATLVFVIATAVPIAMAEAIAIAGMWDPVGRNHGACDRDPLRSEEERTGVDMWHERAIGANVAVVTSFPIREA